MSLPRELLDELLSRYMDGELCGDELDRVEQMLTTDAEVRQSLDLLKERAALVRRAVRDGGKLGADFSSRVFAAAVAEAETANLATNHPLRLAATGGRSATGRRRVVYAGILALAASLVLAAFFATRSFGPGELADNGAGNVAPTTTRNAPQVSDEPSVSGSSVSSDDALANLADSSSDRVVASNQPVGDSLEGPDKLKPFSDKPSTSTMLAEDSMLAEDNASSNKSADIVSADSPAEAGALFEGMSKLRAVMVYEISVTEQGRENNVVGSVFRDAGIRVADERKVDEAMVGHLRESGLVGGSAAELVNGEEGDASRCQLVFLEGSGLKLERAMLAFLEAEDDVSKVGFNMIMNPPVFAAIDRLKEIDPTKVRNTESGDSDAGSMTVAQSITPIGIGGVEGGFVVGNQTFAPLGKNGAKALSQFSSMGQAAGEDITSQVLVIIRFE